MKTRNIRHYAFGYLIGNSEIDEATGCWNWNGSLTKDGYGQIANAAIEKAYGVKGAHRLSLMLFEHWQPADRREQTRHRCHNRRCCNPEHLEPGSAKDNMRDMILAGRSLRGELHPNAKLSWLDVAMIRARRAAGETCAVLAGEFGITRGHVRAVEIGRVWGSVQNGSIGLH